MPNQTTITPPRVPLVDMNTGMITREWYRFFFNLFQLSGGGTNSITLEDLQLGPSSQFANDAEIGKDIDDVATTASTFLGELQQQIDVLRQDIDSSPQPATDFLASVADASVNGLTIGRGAGSVINNTALGALTLAVNTIGNENTAVGYGALYPNTSGAFNTAVGSGALGSNLTGNENSALGRYALVSNNSGYQNVGIGYGALFSNTSGNNNVSIGYRSSFQQSTGFYNVGIGSDTLFSNTGNRNTALGWQALNTCSSGANNTAVGAQALLDLTTGKGNFGAGFVNSAGTHAPVFNVTTEDNRVVMGHTGVTNAYVQVAWTVVSDARDKINFAPVPHGLQFVKQLKPIAFQFRASRNSNEPTGAVRYGFKAQDILDLEGDDPVIIDREDPDKLKYNGESLVPVLVNAIQEQQVMIEELRVRLSRLYGMLPNE